jgi:hypothetical protein
MPAGEHILFAKMCVLSGRPSGRFSVAYRKEPGSSFTAPI